MTAIQLGLRFLRSPIGRFRLLLMFAGAAVAAIALLSMAAIPTVVVRQQARFASQSLTRAEGRTPELFAVRQDDLWHGQFLTRIVIADNGSGTEPPAWLERFPSPGEVMLSPDLRRLRDNNPEIAARFPQREVPGLKEDGLLASDQLLAVVGVTASDIDADGIRQYPDASYYADNGQLGFGGDDSLSGPDPRAIRLMVLGATMFVLVPTAILVVTSARLSWRTTERRLSALRLIGMTPAQIRTIGAVEAAVVSLLGACGGLVLWLLVKPFSGRISIGSLSWWADDVGVAPAIIPAVLAVIVTTTVLMAQVGLRRVEGSPLEARVESAPPKPSLLRVLPLVLGVVVLLVNVALVEPVPTTNWLITFGLGNLLIVAGLVVALPLAAGAASKLMALFARWPVAALSSARIEHEPGVVSRVTAALLTMTFIAGLGLAMSITLQLAVESTIGRPADGRVRLELRTADIEEAQLASLEGVTSVVPIVSFEMDDVWVSGYGTTCETVATMATTTNGSCDTDAVLQPPLSASPEVADVLPTTDVGSPIDFSFDWPLGASGAAADVVLPPSVSRDHLPVTRWIFEVERTTDIDRLTSEIVGMAPGVEIIGVATPDRGRLVSTYKSLILAGMAVGTSITFMSTLAAVGDRSLERRRTANHLSALGLSPRLLRGVEALTLTVPLIIGLIVAVVGAAASIAVYSRLGGLPPALPMDAVLALLLIAVGAIVGIGTTGYLMSSPRLNPSALRSE